MSFEHFCIFYRLFDIFPLSLVALQYQQANISPYSQASLSSSTNPDTARASFHSSSCFLGIFYLKYFSRRALSACLYSSVGITTRMKLFTYLTALCLLGIEAGVHAARAAPRAIPTASLSLQTSATSDQLASCSSTTSVLTISRATTITSVDYAAITRGPDFKPGDEIELSLQQKWHLTTYWSCATLGKDRVFCGW